MLSAKHDLKLVGTPEPQSHLIVDFTWDSDGRAASLNFGDGNTITTADEEAQHTYAAFGTYTATVRSGQASDSADLMLEADEPEPDPEPEDEPVEPESTPEAPESTPEPDDPTESYVEAPEVT